jgi:hypothetical protein
MKLPLKELSLIHHIVVHLELTIPVVPALLVLTLVRVVDVRRHLSKLLSYVFLVIIIWVIGKSYIIV